jgi:hypothetical protein
LNLQGFTISVFTPDNTDTSSLTKRTARLV